MCVSIWAHMEFLKELFIFSWAVINNWAGYCTGGVIVALLWFWSTIKQRPISRKIGTALAIIFLCLAVFNAWREQYIKTLPRLKLHIEQSLIGPSHDHPTDTYILLVVSVSRPYGPPSIAQDWGLTVKPPDESPYKADYGALFDLSQPVTVNLARSLSEYSMVND